MAENSSRSAAGHVAIMALIAWSMSAALAGVVGDEGPVARLLCLMWFALGAWLLVTRWRSR